MIREFNFNPNPFPMWSGGITNPRNYMLTTGFKLFKAIAANDMAEINAIVSSRIYNINELVFTPRNPLSSALHLTTRRHNIPVSRHLVEHGANPLCKDQDGKTPIDYAVSAMNNDILRILINTPDHRGYTLADKLALQHSNQKDLKKLIRLSKILHLTLEYRQPNTPLQIHDASIPPADPAFDPAHSPNKILILNERKLPILTKFTKIDALERDIIQNLPSGVLNLNMQKLADLGIEPLQITGQFLKSVLKRHFNHRVTTLDLGGETITYDLGQYIAKKIIKTKISMSLTTLNISLSHISYSALGTLYEAEMSRRNMILPQLTIQL